MSAKVFSAFRDEDIKKAVKYMEDGAVIIFYSESVYGLATNGYIKESVEKIYKIKKRSREKPLNVLATPSNFTNWCYVPEKWKHVVKKLIELYWPGNLGLILPKKETIPDYVNANLDSVNLVCMDTVAYKMSSFADFLICVTSANFSGEKPITDPGTALNTFKDYVDIFLLGSESPRKQPTTIIDFSKDHAYILRETTISAESLYNTLGIKFKSITQQPCTGASCKIR